MTASALRLFGVVLKNGGGLSSDATRAPGVELVTVRELAAAVESVAAGAAPSGASPPDIERARVVVQTLFEREPVLPAPVGATFKSADQLKRWMELHYVVLSDALGWVERRVGGRVHVRRADGKPGGAAPSVVLADVTRQVEARLIASASLRADADGATVAALVERSVWQNFVAEVARAGERHAGVRVTTTGPWPPYDFVRLQLGS